MSLSIKRGMALAGMLSAAATAVSAQGLADPTRPPASLAATGGVAVASGGPVLQSVMLSPGRKLAMINGQVVALGGRYGSARLVRLTDSEAELRDGAESIVLSLYPQVEKRLAGKMQRGETGAGAGAGTGKTKK